MKWEDGMKKYLVVVAVTSLLLGGCGKNDEPEMEQAGAETASETGQPTGTMTEAPAMAEEPTTEVPTEAEAPMTEEAAPETAMETPAEITAAPAQEGAALAAGKQAYDQICFACHTQGVAGAPKLGDKAAWAPRIAQGMETLVSHAINGFQGTAGVMPPKGGLPSMSDEQVTAAVAYMVEQSQ
jgi:cytochrome c5